MTAFLSTIRQSSLFPARYTRQATRTFVVIVAIQQRLVIRSQFVTELSSGNSKHDLTRSKKQKNKKTCTTYSTAANERLNSVTRKSPLYGLYCENIIRFSARTTRDASTTIGVWRYLKKRSKQRERVLANMRRFVVQSTDGQSRHAWQLFCFFVLFFVCFVLFSIQ